MHTTPVAGHMGNIKPCIGLDFNFFGLGYVLMFLTGSSSVLIVCSRIVGYDRGRN